MYLFLFVFRAARVKSTASLRALRRREISPSTARIGVLGAGIVGVTTAVQIAEAFRDVNVSLIANHFTPHTTSDGAAALWTPYEIGTDTPTIRLRKWCQDTHDFLESLWLSGEGPLVGVYPIFGHRIDTQDQDLPFWHDIVYGYRELTKDELQIYGKEYCFGSGYTTYIAECPKLIPHLMQRFSNANGKTEIATVSSLKELIGKYDVLVNCTGIQAFHVTPDPSVFPIRGQVMRVKAPWIKTFLLDESERGSYFIPTTDSVVVGGTTQEGNWNLNINDTDTHQIWSNCCELVPSMKNAQKLKHWVGLRPGRNSVRLETDLISDGLNKLKVIHNYGHGGAGITLSWGCGKEATELVREQLRHRNTISKL